ncbi:hypothetical protein GCM10011349_45440 [Novosphingobium indicum]|uniref:Uncharacterized protein n=1 Tax=Novosphingobium indicum TaxID=462949 RepID=A0ABQ2K2K4_9SPHN|nr:hypothetical protein GCM10011349_45440 [Novosphingobium indicum]
MPVDMRNVSTGSARKKLKNADARTEEITAGTRPALAPTSVIPSTKMSPDDTSPSSIGCKTTARTDVTRKIITGARQAPG